MSTGKITLQGHIDVPAERLEEVRSALPVHISLTQKEPGCLSFNVTENANITGRFDVYEEFATREAFDTHQKRGAASTWAEITAGIPRHYSISETA